MKKYKIQNKAGGYCFKGTLEECEKEYKELNQEAWEITEFFEDTIGELLGEGGYRKVYQDKNSEFWVIKIAKDSIGEQMNREEADLFIQQETFLKRAMNIPDAMAKCYYDSKTKYLHMEKLPPLKGSKNLGLNKNGICKTFDLF